MEVKVVGLWRQGGPWEGSGGGGEGGGRGGGGIGGVEATQRRGGPAAGHQLLTDPFTKLPQPLPS